MSALHTLLALAVLVPGPPPEREPAPAALKCHRNAAAQALRAATASAGADSSDPAARLVRPAPPVAPAVYVVDGRVVDRAVFDAVDRTTVESVTVVCSDPRHRALGVEPGRDLVIVTTRSAARPERGSPAGSPRARP